MKEGVALIEEGVAMMQENMEKLDVAVMDEGAAMIKEATEKSDEVMIEKATAMIQEALEKSAEAIKSQPLQEVEDGVIHLGRGDHPHRGFLQAGYAAQPGDVGVHVGVLGHQIAGLLVAVVPRRWKTG